VVNGKLAHSKIEGGGFCDTQDKLHKVMMVVEQALEDLENEVDTSSGDKTTTTKNSFIPQR